MLVKSEMKRLSWCELDHIWNNFTIIMERMFATCKQRRSMPFEYSAVNDALYITSLASA